MKLAKIIEGRPSYEDMEQPDIKELSFIDTAGECVFGKNPDGEYIEIDFKIFCWKVHLDLPLYS